VRCGLLLWMSVYAMGWSDSGCKIKRQSSPSTPSSFWCAGMSLELFLWYGGGVGVQGFGVRGVQGGGSLLMPAAGKESRGADVHDWMSWHAGGGALACQSKSAQTMVPVQAAFALGWHQSLGQLHLCNIELPILLVSCNYGWPLCESQSI
jgi:hypothetical protein